jgi:glutamate 5-kinase
MSRRIVVKLGTSSLTGGTKRLSRRRMLEIARQTAALHEAGHRVIVVSSGAMAAGREALGDPELDRSLPAKQMLSAVGQGRLIQIWGELFGLFDLIVGQVLLTRGDFSNRTGYLNARDTLFTLLAHRIIPIINENDTVATDEIRVGDNDNLSALVANLIDADLLILLTDQLGLYDADPRANPGAKLISHVERLDERVFALAGGSSTGLGTGGMITKLQAAQLAGQGGTTTVIASSALPDVLVRIVAGGAEGPIGTTIAPAMPHRESRKRWVLSEKAQGTLMVDDGAAERLRNGGASLLAVGIREVGGEFERGAPVHVLTLAGKRIAAGVTNYAGKEIRQIVGVKSAQIANVLGYEYGEAVIHRDNLALFDPPEGR